MPTVSGIIVATGAETGGRRTLLDVVDELSRPVNAADSTIRALAADAFRAAVRTMNRKGLWPWEIMDEDVNITANQALSAVASGIKKPLAMHYLSAQAGVEDQGIQYCEYSRFLEQYDLNITGEAQIYTIPNIFETGQIRWWPIPNGDDYARFHYYRVTPAPRVESEAIEIPDYAMECYMSFAWYEFCKRLTSGLQPMPITVAMAEAKQAFREMSSHVNVPGDRSRRVTAGW